jgi:hypothetical protein
MNVTVLRGTIASAPLERLLASGSRVVQFDVATTTEHGLATVPVSWADPPAVAPAWAAGDEIALLGEVRRRFFRVAGATQSRTEVVVESAARPTQRRQVARLMEAAVARVGSW